MSSSVRVKTEDGYIKVTDHREFGQTAIGLDAFSKTGGKGEAYNDLTVKSAKELVRALIDLIEEREGQPF